MFGKLTIVAAVMLSSTAFIYTATVPAGLTVPVKTGPNSVMSSTALPNDNTEHPPYLGWRGTANADVIYAGQPVIKKGDALGGHWGGRHSSTTNMGFLLITLTTVNGQNVVAGRYSQSGAGNGKDTGIRAGTVIPLQTCHTLNRFGGCAS